MDLNDAAVAAAAERIMSRVQRTPLYEVPSEDLPGGVRLLLKLECTQVAGAFKARGAHHFISRLLDAGRPAGVMTYSSGNHGRAVAEAARAEGIAALVVVPDHVDPSKEANIRAAGAEVVYGGPTSQSRKDVADSLSAERGWVIIPPFDHPWIIAGQATAGREILEEIPEPTGVWTPVGGGGLAAGLAVALREASPSTTLNTVEPEGASTFASSHRAGELRALETADSVADGLLPLRVGSLNWHVLSTQGDWSRPVVAHTVSDSAITRNFARLIQRYGLAVEPSAAVSSVPFFDSEARSIEPGVHVAIVSGSNVSDERRQRLLSEAGDAR